MTNIDCSDRASKVYLPIEGKIKISAKANDPLEITVTEYYIKSRN